MIEFSLALAICASGFALMTLLLSHKQGAWTDEALEMAERGFDAMKRAEAESSRLREAIARGRRETGWCVECRARTASSQCEHSSEAVS